MLVSRSARLASHLAQQLHHARAAQQSSCLSTQSDASPTASEGSQDTAHPDASHVDEATGASDAAQPPADWYKRGQWVDPAQMMKRMTNEEPAQAVQKEPETVVGKHLSALIKYRGGPVTVAEYMREVLAHPAGGVYTAHGAQAIGEQGHFVTSPEISALFGETIAAWVLQHYQQLLRSCKKVALVELGPGKGTLMKQMLAAFGMMQGGADVLKAITVHLVEVSPALRQAQYDALQCSSPVTEAQVPTEAPDDAPRKPRIVGSTKPAPLSHSPINIKVEPQPPPQPETPVDTNENVSEGVLRMGSAAAVPWQDAPKDAPQTRLSQQAPKDALASADCAMTGGKVHWHASLADVRPALCCTVPYVAQVPQDMPCIIIGHEFFDALPVHSFRKDADRGWLEVLVDEPVDSTDSSRRFDFALSPRGTRATASILPRRLDALRKPQSDALRAIEVGAEAMTVAEEAALRIARSGGFALFIDYGQDSPYESSLNAIRHHQAVHPLQEPGSADITAWVDFSALRQAVKARKVPVRTAGPIQQGHFLLANGIESRVDALLEKPGRTDKEVEALEEGLARLCAGTQHHAQGMGETYKVMALVPTGTGTPFPFDLDFEKLQAPSS